MCFLKLLLEVLGSAGAAAIGGALLIISVEAVRWMGDNREADFAASWRKWLAWAKLTPEN